MSKKTVREIEVTGKKVLVRTDFNVPFGRDGDQISDDWRIRVAIPTIRLLLERGAGVILCSHLGRPNGQLKEELRLAPVACRLSELLGRDIDYSPDYMGRNLEEAAAKVRPGQIMLLENIRFHPEEEQNDEEFARQLASLADVYVNDAFSSSHRAHASIAAITRYLPAVAGLLMATELDMLGRVLEDPPRPLAAVIGGAKVSDKIGVLEHLTYRANVLLIGGGMVATFLRAQGYSVGSSPVEADRLEFARALTGRSNADVSRICLPEDVVVGSRFSADASPLIVSSAEIPDGSLILDIGPLTVARYERELRQCKMVIWNGPMGVFEWDAFSGGTRGIATALANLRDAITVAGGGSTAEVAAALGITESLTLVSTGGGATLEFLEGSALPGVIGLLEGE